MLARIGQKSPMKFTEVCERHKPTGFDDGEYLCSDVNDVRRLYAHNPLVPEGNGADALTRRLESYETGARLVKQALADQYRADLAKDALAAVEEKTGRDLGEGMTRGDLDLIQQELHRFEKLREQRRELEMLQTLAKNHSPEDVIEDSLVAHWQLTTCLDKLPVPWPNSDTRVELRNDLHERCILCSTMQFVESEVGSERGVLVLTFGGKCDREENKRALTRFVHGNFGARPGQPAFQNVANNVLSYLSDQREYLSDQRDYVVRRMRAIVGWEKICRSSAVATGTFTLSVKENGNVFVAGRTSSRFDIEKPDIVRPAGRADLLKYRFVHQGSFEISGAKLRSDRFNPRASLVSVDGLDTVELAD